MTLSDVLLLNAGAIAGLMFVVWLISVPLRDVSIVDLIWGLGFVFVAVLTFVRTSGSGPSRWMLVSMATLWGLRLSGYLAWRNIGKGEDKRYVAMREKRGSSFVFSSLLLVFGLQGVVMWVVSLPLQTGILFASDGWTWLHIVGAVFWATGVFFESVGDFQLARFKANPENQGQVMDRGLWRYTRHPNYFGDFMVWWGLYLTSIAHGDALWTIVSPIVMSIFLMKVSGVTLLESSLKETRPGYAQYVQETNAFFPSFPRK